MVFMDALSRAYGEEKVVRRVENDNVIYYVGNHKFITIPDMENIKDGNMVYTRFGDDVKYEVGDSDVEKPKFVERVDHVTARRLNAGDIEIDITAIGGGAPIVKLIDGKGALGEYLLATFDRTKRRILGDNIE